MILSCVCVCVCVGAGDTYPSHRSLQHYLPAVHDALLLIALDFNWNRTSALLWRFLLNRQGPNWSPRLSYVQHKNLIVLFWLLPFRQAWTSQASDHTFSDLLGQTYLERVQQSTVGRSMVCHGTATREPCNLLQSCLVFRERQSWDNKANPKRPSSPSDKMFDITVPYSLPKFPDISQEDSWSLQAPFEPCRCQQPTSSFRSVHGVRDGTWIEHTTCTDLHGTILPLRPQLLCIHWRCQWHSPQLPRRC